MFKILDKNGLQISLDKCEFFKTEIDFLGCTISENGNKPPKSKIEEISNIPKPTDYKGLRRFLGMTGFYRHMIPNYAKIVAPLTELIRL